MLLDVGVSLRPCDRQLFLRLSRGEERMASFEQLLRLLVKPRSRSLERGPRTWV